MQNVWFFLQYLSWPVKLWKVHITSYWFWIFPLLMKLPTPTHEFDAYTIYVITIFSGGLMTIRKRGNTIPTS